MKATTAAEVRRFQDIPNIGRAMEADLILPGIRSPKDLIGKDAFTLYQSMCRKSGRQDPCVLDTYISAIAFMEGAAARPWWAYTEERKRTHPSL
jgi:hypothetical protein